MGICCCKKKKKSAQRWNQVQEKIGASHSGGGKEEKIKLDKSGKQIKGEGDQKGKSGDPKERVKGDQEHPKRSDRRVQVNMMRAVYR